MPHLMPTDVGTLRAVADELLASDEMFPRFDELADRTSQLRRHLRNLIPAVERAAQALPDGHIRAANVAITVANARAQLTADPGPGLVSATQHARSLARELRALCHHHDTLTRAPSGGER